MSVRSVQGAALDDEWLLRRGCRGREQPRRTRTNTNELNTNRSVHASGIGVWGGGGLSLSVQRVVKFGRMTLNLLRNYII